MSRKYVKIARKTNRIFITLKTQLLKVLIHGKYEKDFRGCV